MSPRRRKTPPAAPTTGQKSRARAFVAKHRPHPIRFCRRHGHTIRKTLLILAVFLCCAIPVPFVNSAIGYVPLISVVTLVVVSFVYLQILKRSLSFSEESLIPSCERGRAIEFTVNFANSSPLVFTRLEATFYISDLFGETDVSIPASMPLMPFEERDFSFDASFDHIGIYNAGVEQIVIGDLLGLFSHTVTNDNRHSVRVLPRLFDVDAVDLEEVSVQETQTMAKPIVTDDMDYAGVRDYEIGDPLKNIHWNLSARNPNGEYFTRLFEVFGNPGLTIVIDTSAPDYSHEGLMQVFDGVVESALSVARYAREKGMDVELAYRDRAGERVKTHALDISDSDELVDNIPKIHAGGSLEGAELLRLEGCGIHAQGNIAYCTAHIDEAVVSTLVAVKNSRHNPLLYLVVPSELEGQARHDFMSVTHRLDDAQIAVALVEPAKQGRVS